MLQTVLPDMSLLKGQKLVENAKKLQHLNETFKVIFKQCATQDIVSVFECWSPSLVAASVELLAIH